MSMLPDPCGRRSCMDIRAHRDALREAAKAMLKMARFIFGDDENRWPAQWREELQALERAAENKL